MSAGMSHKSDGIQLTKGAAMFQAWKKFSILLVMTMAFAACHRLEPVYNVEQDSVPAGVQQKLSSEQIGRMIAKTAAGKGWVVSEVKPGLLHCIFKWRDHSAAINIAYSRQDYSIELDSSENLKESDGMIHRKYNKYVHDLQNEIDKKFSQAAFNE
jgi:hypothetical protein